MNESDSHSVIRQMLQKHPASSFGYSEIAPIGGLAHRVRRHDPVEALWAVHDTGPRDFLVLPDGRADLIARFRVREDQRCADIVPMLVGPSSVARVVPIAREDSFIGVRLRPGRLCAIGPASELADRRLAGADAIARVPALRRLPTTAGSIEAVTEVFVGIVGGLHGVSFRPDVEAALDRLHLAGGRLGAGDLAASLGLAPRRLHRLFARHVGLSPHGYAAVLRFQRAVRLQRRGLSLAATAHDAGYADQPHMTRAYRRHAGVTPARLPEVALGSLPLC